MIGCVGDQPKALQRNGSQQVPVFRPENNRADSLPVTDPEIGLS
jgi:hypothetical protein